MKGNERYKKQRQKQVTIQPLKNPQTAEICSGRSNRIVLAWGVSENLADDAYARQKQLSILLSTEKLLGCVLEPLKATLACVTVSNMKV